MQIRLSLFLLLTSLSSLGASVDSLNAVSEIETKKIEEEISSCPSSPNCVSSLTSSKKHFLEPWKLNGEVEAVKDLFKKKILSHSGVKLRSEGAQHLHFVFTSSFFKFKDDLWILFDKKNELIQFKSASRKGHSDFGVNKKRISKIKKWYFKL